MAVQGLSKEEKNKKELMDTQNSVVIARGGRWGEVEEVIEDKW